MKKIVLAYGLLGGVLIAGLKMVEYRFLVLEHSLEIYGGIVALIFSTLGIWLGLKLTRTREVVVVKEVPPEVRVAGPFKRNERGGSNSASPRASSKSSRLSRRDHRLHVDGGRLPADLLRRALVP